MDEKDTLNLFNETEEERNIVWKELVALTKNLDELKARHSELYAKANKIATFGIDVLGMNPEIFGIETNSDEPSANPLPGLGYRDSQSNVV